MNTNDQGDLLPGTLEMLILLTLRRGPLHGYAIAHDIQQTSDELLRVEEGSLYPALHRMLRDGWISAKWGISARKRRIRIYSLTAAGRKQLGREVSRVGRVMEGIALLMKPIES